MPIYTLIGMVYGWPVSQNQSFTYSGNIAAKFSVIYNGSND